MNESPRNVFRVNLGKTLLAGIVLFGALIYLGFITFKSATVYYYTVSEIRSQGDSTEGKLVRVSGKLVPESFERMDGSTEARFSLTDGDTDIVAVHNGLIPDLFFNQNSEIILEGIYDPDDSFKSHNVIVKCPSKYVAVETKGGPED